MKPLSLTVQKLKRMLKLLTDKQTYNTQANIQDKNSTPRSFDPGVKKTGSGGEKIRVSPLQLKSGYPLLPIRAITALLL